MSEFSMTDYLNSKIDPAKRYNPQVVPTTPLGVIPVGNPGIYGAEPYKKGKTDELIDATQDKAFELRMAKLAKIRELEEIRKQSVVGRLNLESDSLLGAPLNFAVGMGASLSRITGQIGNQLNVAEGAALASKIPDGAIEAYEREKAGQATAEDLELLGLPSGRTEAMKNPTLIWRERMKDAQTNRERIAKYEDTIKNSKELRKFFDLSSAVDKTYTNRLLDDIVSEATPALERFGKGSDQFAKGDYLDAIGNFAAGVPGFVGAAVPAAFDNPLGTVEAITDQAANLMFAAAGGVGGTLVSLAYGADTYAKAIEHANTNYGIPKEDDRESAAILAGTAAGMEKIGQLAMGLGSAKQASVASTSLTKALARQLAKPVKGYLGEGFTELGQGDIETVLEGQLPTGETRAQNFGLGAIVGATAGPAIGTAKLGAKAVAASVDPITKAALATPAVLKTGLDKAKEAKLPTVAGTVDTAKQAFEATKSFKDSIFKRVNDKEAVANNDISGYMAPEEVTKKQWTNAANVLVANANLPDKEEKDVEANLGRLVDEVATPLETEISKLKIFTEKGREDIYGVFIAEAEAKKKQTTDPEEIAKLDENIAKYKAILAKPVNQGLEAKAFKALEKLEPELQEVIGLRKGLEQKLASMQGTETVQSIAKTILEPVSTPDTTVGSTAAVQAPTEASIASTTKLIARAMQGRATTAQDADVMEQVANSGLVTPEQATQLRVYSEEVRAILRSKNSAGVQKDIIEGSLVKGNNPFVNFKGILQWKAEFDSSVKQVDKKHQYDGLKAFLTDQAAKATLMANMVRGQVLNKTSTGGKWVVRDATHAEAGVVTDGGSIDGFNTISSNLGAKRQAEEIQKALAIGLPILKGLAQRLNLDVEAEVADIAKGIPTSKPLAPEGKNDTKTPEAKQTKEKGQEVPTATGTDAEVKPTEAAKKEVTPTNETVKTGSTVSNIVTLLKKIYNGSNFSSVVGVYATVEEAFKAAKLNPLLINEKVMWSIKSDRLGLKGTGVLEHWFQYNENRIPKDLMSKLLALSKEGKKTEIRKALEDFAKSDLESLVSQHRTLFVAPPKFNFDAVGAAYDAAFGVHEAAYAGWVDRDTPHLTEYVTKNMPRYIAAYKAGALLSDSLVVAVEAELRTKGKGVKRYVLTLQKEQVFALNDLLEEVANIDAISQHFVLADTIKTMVKDPEFIPGYLKSYINDVLSVVSKANKAGFSSFATEYRKVVNAAKTEGVTEIKTPEKGTWYKYNKASGKASDSFVTEALTARSICTWCTSYGAAEEYLEVGDFWVYADSTGKTKFAVQFNGEGVGQIQNSNNKGKVSSQEASVFDWLANSGNLSELQSNRLKSKLESNVSDSAGAIEQANNLDEVAERAYRRRLNAAFLTIQRLNEYDNEYYSVYEVAHYLEAAGFNFVIDNGQIVINGDFKTGTWSDLISGSYFGVVLANSISEITGDFKQDYVDVPGSFNYAVFRNLKKISGIVDLEGQLYDLNNALEDLTTHDWITLEMRFPALDGIIKYQRIHEKELLDYSPSSSGFQNFDDDIPFSKKDGKVQGFFYEGKSYLVASNIEAGTEYGVILHEIGAHLGMEKLLGKVRYDKLVKQIQTWENTEGVEGNLAKLARLRVNTAATPEHQQGDELLAYFIEEAVKAGFKPGQDSLIAKFLKAVENAIKTALEVLDLDWDTSKLTAQDIVYLAHGAALNAVPNTVPKNEATTNTASKQQTDQSTPTVAATTASTDKGSSNTGETDANQVTKPKSTVKVAVFDGSSKDLDLKKINTSRLLDLASKLETYINCMGKT